MQATLHSVEGRSEVHEGSYAAATDFVRGPAESTSALRVLEEPGWSPYCIDVGLAELVFVRLPAATNLAHAAFYRITQPREAEAILRLPLAQVAGLAHQLPDPATIFVFSMGRCGSTLVSHALNGSGSVCSLSEPAVFDHRQLRELAATNEVSDLIRDLVRLLFASRTFRVNGKLAVKFRSQTLFIAKMFWKALPDARYVFMYRDAVSWGESFLQFLIDVGIGLPLNVAGRDFYWMMISADRPVSDLSRFMDLEERPISVEKTLAPGWTIHLEEYHRLLDAGVPFLALRYNELIQHPETELARLFAHCGIPPSGIAGALKAFNEDSQKGTAIGRKGSKRRFDATGSAAFRATLGASLALGDPNLILPDCYRGLIPESSRPLSPEQTSSV